MKKFLIVVAGLHMCLLALLCFLIGISLLFIPPTNYQANDAIPWGGILFLLIIGLGFGTTGLGLFFRKNWARIILFIFSGFCLLTALPTVSVTIFMPNNQANSKFLIIYLSFVVLFEVIIPIFYGIFFTRPSVKALFVKSTTVDKSITEIEKPSVSESELSNQQVNTSSTVQRPIGIRILSVVLVLGAISSIMSLGSPYINEIPVFGFTLSGWDLKLYILITALLNIYLGYGVWQLKKHAWVMCIGVQILGLLTQLYFIFWGNIDALMKSSTPYAVEVPPLLMKLIFTGSMIPLIVILCYLLKTKSLFFNKASLENESPA